MLLFNEKDFKNRLTKIIKANFESDQDLSKAMDISLSTAHRWRNQKLIPKIDLLAKFAILTKNSLDYIVLGKDASQIQ